MNRQILGAAMTVTGLVVATAAQCAAPDDKEPQTTSVRPVTPPIKKATPKPTAQPGTPVRVAKKDRSCQLVKVVDGDTLDARCARGMFRVRVIGIDTPEVYGKKECYGPEATAAARMILNPEMLVGITLVTDPSQADRDRYGRYLRYVEFDTIDAGYVGTGDFGEYMLEMGAAREYTYDRLYDRRAAYKKAEAEAKRDSDGLWGAC